MTLTNIEMCKSCNYNKDLKLYFEVENKFFSMFLYETRKDKRGRCTLFYVGVTEPF